MDHTCLYVIGERKIALTRVSKHGLIYKCVVKIMPQVAKGGGALILKSDYMSTCMSVSNIRNILET